MSEWLMEKAPPRKGRAKEAVKEVQTRAQKGAKAKTTHINLTTLTSTQKGLEAEK
jgi:ribosomal protein L31E